VIAVLTDDPLDHADAMFSFFQEHGIHDVGFNMEETEGSNRESSLGPAAAKRAMAPFWSASGS
jgi:hypothetical protein